MKIEHKLVALLLGLSLAGAAGAQQAPAFNDRPPNGANQTPAFPGQTRAPILQSKTAFEVTSVATGLERPWGLTFLPDGAMLVTELPGRMRIVTTGGALSEAVAGLPAVDARGQGGLLDVTLDPDYADNGLIYWSYAQPRENGQNNTAVARGRLIREGNAPRVENVQVIFEQAPSLDSRLHFGSRLVFAADKTLFVTLGERSITEGRMQAQQMDSLLGKIVRINRDGSVPADNPFVGKASVRPEIWSSGHRSVQGAAFDPVTGKLWAVEHGARGGDELNLIRKGLDYGWPTIAYGIEYRGEPITGGITQKDGMEQPVYYWDPVVAPGGITFYDGALFPEWKGSLFVAGLGSTSLARLTLQDDKVTGEERFLTDRKQRIRAVRQGPDGALYLLTDVGQGEILKITPAK